MVHNKSHVIILGAGNSLVGEAHSGLVETQQGALVLDWLRLAYTDISPNIQFVGGYKVKEIERRYPEFKYILNSDWKNTGPTGSLFCADLPDNGHLYVSYSDILYRKNLINNISACEADLVVVIDSQWKDRYQGRSKEDLARSEKVFLAGHRITSLGIELDENEAQAEFIGLVKISGAALDFLKKIKKNYPERMKESKLSALVEWIRVRGFNVEFIDTMGDWAEMDDPKDLAHFVLGTKAQTLERLASVVSESTILDQYTFSVHDWNNNPKSIVKGVMNSFPNNRIVARSSALSEDGFSTANAGAYDSVLNIDNEKPEEIEKAIFHVINSYSDNNPNNQVLVQPMVTDVSISGVAFTRTLSHGAPYYVINYDDQTGSTDSITSGNSISHKTFVLRRDKLHALERLPSAIIQLCRALHEIEQLVNYDSLDVEFAIDHNDEVFILQVRPIAVDHSEWDISDAELVSFIEKGEERFKQLNNPLPNVKGKHAVFGVMPDWNPAEIIGVTPGRLATSLYKAIIMNDIWSTQRFEYGYRDVRPTPLLITFAGHPYVDVRASFNSFIPNSIDDDLSEKLVEFYLNYLTENPAFHDKVEFEVVPTCYDLNFEKWRNRLAEANFTTSEINALETALHKITSTAITKNQEYYDHLEILNKKFESAQQTGIHPISRAYYLLEDCKRYGTVPFSHLARSAFVAVSLIRSAVEKGIISTAAKDDFLNTIYTVSHEFTKGVSDLSEGHLALEDFLKQYGHIRPGTYDITSKNYREDPDYYIKPLLQNPQSHSENGYKYGKIWSEEKGKFAEACRENGIMEDLKTIEQFMRKAIEGREYAKFLFTRNLSAAMECIVEYGNMFNIKRGEMANITWEEILSSLDLDEETDAMQGHFKRMAAAGKKWQHLASAVELPPLLTSVKDFWWFYFPNTQANFVGRGQITAECIDISIDFDVESDLAGKIVLIPQADPGYEWLFGRKIAGLITMYGGANSHMAIRAAEFKLCAAIGIGEKEYKRLSGSRIITLDAGNKKIQIVQ